MNQELETAKKIAAYLDRGTAELKPGIAYRLQQARSAALVRLAQPAHAAELVYAAGKQGSALRRAARRPAGPLSLLGILLLIAAGWFGWQQWQAFQQVKEYEELDSQILSSDLPIDAYLDRGFQNWLKTSFDR